MKTALLILATVNSFGSETLAFETMPRPTAASSIVSGRFPSAPAARTARRETAWRYVYHQGRWWYWSPEERWSYFDGSRWVQLDSLNQPLTLRGGGELSQRGLREFKPLPPQELPAQLWRPGSFSVGSAPFAGRSFAGPFSAGAVSPAVPIFAPRVYGPTSPSRYGPDSAYGPYGSTDPFRSGIHSGSGGNYGYGLGAPRPAAVGNSGQVAP